MSRKDYMERTRLLAKITRIACRITVIASLVGLGIFLLTIVLVNVVPAEHIKPLQTGGNLQIVTATGDMIPAEVFTSVKALRAYLWELLGRVSAGMAIFVIAAFHVMGLLKSVESGTPFAQENVRRLRKISIVVIIGSVLVPSISAAVTAAARHLDLLELKSGSMVDVTLLLCGLLVLILSGVFAYGARLQREHDQTV
jgi:hypothetical protein